MPKLLTVAIPTYNRAGMLDRQLSWLASEIKGYENECDILVNDNCSSDSTMAVLAQWESAFRETSVMFTPNRHARNIGGMANIVACIENSTGDYVWTLGDDDPIQDGTISHVLSLIKKNRDLSLILLDGIGRDQHTGEILYQRFFRSASESPIRGAKIFEKSLVNDIAGVLLISSAVYNSKLVKQALATWPDSSKNLAAQAYWVAYCAAKGDYVITPTLHTEAAMGIGFTDKDPQWMFKMIFMGFPQVYLKLLNVGYSKRFCFGKIVENLTNVTGWRILLGGLRRWFTFAVKGLVFYMGCVLSALWKIVIGRQKSPVL